MAKLTTELFVLCDYATISQEQKLSIIGIFDQFFVANLPAQWPRMFLVAVFKGEAGREYPLNFQIIPPQKTDQNLPKREFKVTLGPNGKANLITELVNLPIPFAGLYKVEIKSEDEKVGEIWFNVNKTTASYAGQDLQGKKIPNWPNS